jgi:proteasome alpha subunit
MSIPMYVPPEQLIKDRAEFARKGIARGRSIVALEYRDGILLMGENPSGALHKVSELYDRMAFAGVGRYNEFESLRVAGIRYADLKGYAYGRDDVSAKGLANAYSQTLGHIFTAEVKPYEVEVLVCEVGTEPGHTQLFRVQFDGTLDDTGDWAAIGGSSEATRQLLESRFEDAVPLDRGIAIVASIIEEAEGHPIAPDAWEAAVLDRTAGRRMFRRLVPADIAAARA